MRERQSAQLCDNGKVALCVERAFRLLDSRAVSMGPVRGRVAAALGRLSTGRLRIVGLVCVLVALGSWAVASPVGASPDEDYHLVSIWCSHGERPGLCEAPTATSAVVPAQFLHSNCFAFHPEQSAACTRDIPNPAMVRSDRGNFSKAYPPVFYWVDGIFAGHDFNTSVIIMRMVNLVLFLAVFTGVYLLLPVGLRRAQLLGTLLTLVPLGVFLIPSINPSSWAMLSAATFLTSLLGYLTVQDRRRRIALGAAAALTLLIGAGARGDSASYAVVAVAVAVILAVPLRPVPWRRLIYPAVLAVAAGVAFLWVGQAGSADPSQSTAGHFSPGKFLRIAIDVPDLWMGGAGSKVGDAPIDWGLGWLDTGMPGIVWVFVGCLFAAVVFYAMTGATWRRMIAAGLVLAAAWLIPTYLLYITDQPVGYYLQPRYVLPLFTILAVVAMARLDGNAFRLTRGQRWTAVSVLALANAAALFFNIRRYVSGNTGTSSNLDANIQWWWNTPIPPMAVCAVGAIAFALAVALLTADLSNVEPAVTPDSPSEGRILFTGVGAIKGTETVPSKGERPSPRVTGERVPSA